MELDALAQVEGVGHSIVRDVPRLRQLRLDDNVVVNPREVLVDERLTAVPGVGRFQVRLQAGHVYGGGIDQRTSWFGPCLGRSLLCGGFLRGGRRLGSGWGLCGDRGYDAARNKQQHDCQH